MRLNIHKHKSEDHQDNKNYYRSNWPCIERHHDQNLTSAIFIDFRKNWLRLKSNSRVGVPLICTMRININSSYKTCFFSLIPLTYYHCHLCSVLKRCNTAIESYYTQIHKENSHFP